MKEEKAVDSIVKMINSVSSFDETTDVQVDDADENAMDHLTQAQETEMISKGLSTLKQLVDPNEIKEMPEKAEAHHAAFIGFCYPVHVQLYE